MENENKNGSAPANNHHNHHHKKNRQQKPKSYFIDPNAQPAEQSKQEVKADAPKQENRPANANHQGNPHNHKNNHKNHHNRNHKPQQNSSANADAPEQKTQKPAEESKQTEQNSSAQKNTSNNNKNKNKNRNHHEKRQHQKENNSSVQSVEEVPSSASDKLNASENITSFAKSADKLQRPAPQKLKKLSESPESEQYAEYDEFSFEELYGSDESNSTAEKDNDDATDNTATDKEPTVDVVGIRFKSSGKTYYFAPNGIHLRTGSHAIVETARGLEYGEVAIGNTKVCESDIVPPLRPIIRKATDADVKHHNENKEKEDEAFRICNEKIIAHELDMKLIDAQYTFDNTKLLFYFTSSGRVDFRDLVKDLASVFRTRIELRQIGIRDEAKMVGGLGLCGRPLCCSLFLTDFGQVSIKMAKEQNLSLNSSKISGICGRLMCCLRYEHETYEYEIKRTPPVDSLVRTVDGVGVVTEINPLAATIKVKLVSSPDTPPKAYKRDEVTVLKKKQENS